MREQVRGIPCVPPASGEPPQAVSVAASGKEGAELVMFGPPKPLQLQVQPKRGCGVANRGWPGAAEHVMTGQRSHAGQCVRDGRCCPLPSSLSPLSWWGLAWSCTRPQVQRGSSQPWWMDRLPIRLLTLEHAEADTPPEGPVHCHEAPGDPCGRWDLRYAAGAAMGLPGALPVANAPNSPVGTVPQTTGRAVARSQSQNLTSKRVELLGTERCRFCRQPSGQPSEAGQGMGSERAQWSGSDTESQLGGQLKALGLHTHTLAASSLSASQLSTARICRP